VTLEDAQKRLHELITGLEPSALALRQFGKSPAEIQERFLDLEHATRDEVDAAVAEFAAIGTLPVLTPAESGMLYLRAMQANDFVGGLLAWAHREQREAEEEGLKERDRETLLSWLLIEYWDDIGFGVVMGVIEDIAHGNRRAEERHVPRN
jgi:hypothetical protein